MKKVISSILLLLGVHCGFAQTYGNEWIDHSQDYYKLKISEEGIHRISYDYLDLQGLPVSGIKTAGIQLFHRGEEISLMMQDNGDGIFGSGDYFEFFGKTNDGELDKDLYQDESFQPHSYISLFSDTSIYMLTWNDAKVGKRVSDYYNADYSGLRDSFINYTQRKVFEEEWYDGILNLDFSDQCLGTRGEGYMTNRITKIVRTVPLSAVHFVDFGNNPTVRVKVHGRSNPNIYVGGKNHVFEIKHFESGRVLNTIRENGYYEDDQSYEIFPTEIADRFFISFQSQASDFDNSAVSIMELNYTRGYDLDGNKSFSFKHDGRLVIGFDNKNASTSDIYLFDKERNRRVRGDIKGDSVLFNLSYKGLAEMSSFYLYDSTAFISYAGSVQKAQMLNQSPGSFDYLIVTHSKLKSAADQYSAYRASVPGRNFTPLLVTTEQLYNEFFFGFHHPLALKNFCKYYYQQQNTPPTHVLLLGKGNLYPELKQPGVLELGDLVPTIGFPPSDNLIVAGLGNDPSSLAMDMAVGRVPADTEKEILDYLDKLKSYELNLNQDYKKHVLHIAGGASESENKALRKALKDYSEVFSGKEFGGWRTLVSKSTASSVSFEHKDAIQATINDGVGLMTYFGHGSSNVLDVDIGPASTLSNSGKYPIFYFNGCVLGNTFSVSSLCEEYLFEPNKGAIAWMASTSVGLTNYLDGYSTDYHRIAFKEDYGKSIGEWMAKTTKTYLNQGSLYNERQTTQFVIHGDPAIQLFDASLPDFSLEENGIHVKEDALFIAENDSLTLVLPALNYGKATDDTLDINIQIESSSGTKFYFPMQRYDKIYSKDTLEFGLSIKDLGLNGLITFLIELDSSNAVAEKGSQGELNNSFRHEYFLSLTGVQTLFPLENSIINSTRVKLEAQNADLFAGEVEYYIEIDTTPSFNSPGLQQSGLLRGRQILSHEFNLLPIDSVDYFWRCRLNLPMDEGGEWNVSTFTMIFNSPTGWSQGYYTKFQTSSLDRINIDSATRDWIFGRTTVDPLEIWTSGGNDLARKNGRKFLTHHSFASCDWFNYDGIELMAINPDNEWRYDEKNNPFNQKPTSYWCSPPAGFEKFYMTDSTTGEYRYNTTDSVVRDSLIAFLNRIPNGYHLMVKNGWHMGIEEWEDDVFDAFEQFGIIGLRNQKKLYPFGIFGQKGEPLGSAQEHYADTSLAEDPTTQGFRVGKLIQARVTEGSVKSRRVGPSSKWTSAHFIQEGIDHSNDQYEFTVWGIDPIKDTMVVLAKGSQRDFDLSAVNASTYPYVQLEARLQDVTLRTPNHIKRWTVLYDGVPEGTLDPSIAFKVDNDTVAQGDTLKVQLAFKNISTLDMDSLLVTYELENETYTYDSTVRLDSLKAGEHLVLEHDFATASILEDVKLKVSVNPDFDQPEVSLHNNIFFKNIVISRDRKNPILDVLFDGIHIMNMDVVHAKPVITLSANDDNEHLLLDDVSLFTLQLRNVNDAQFTTIDLTGPDVTFTPQVSADKNAVIEFRPQDLTSGTYELVAQVTDRSGNSQPNEYSIRFQIISESKISHVYPYPNPFTTQTRFVFTLTGEVIPDDMSITIMNVRGQIVREIGAVELGPLRIGHNVTDFAWDGTDNFGDRLANGVYFYKVNMGKDQENFEHYETSADALNMFKHELGKIYIAR